MNTFNELGYQIVQNAISEESAAILSTIFSLQRDYDMFKNMDKIVGQIPYGGDEQVANSFAKYSPLYFDGLLDYIRPKVQEASGLKLYPCYSYARIYYNGAEMSRHIDRPSCEISATMTLSVDETGPWQIWFKDFKEQEKPLTLNVGDMCVYQGTKLEHWRESYSGSKQVQVFLHYVRRDGEYSDYRFDKRPLLGSTEADIYKPRPNKLDF